MSETIDIRHSAPEDATAIEAVYNAAFPEENLVPLVRELLDGGDDVMSLVATRNGALAGHVVFTTCGIKGGDVTVALLGPLAVAPEFQKQGIGGALVKAGFREVEKAGVYTVCVLGDPGYYGRFGFTVEADITPPYEMPPEWRDAWQSVGIGDAKKPATGKLTVPAPWQPRELWLP